MATSQRASTVALLKYGKSRNDTKCSVFERFKKIQNPCSEMWTTSMSEVFDPGRADFICPLLHNALQSQKVFGGKSLEGPVPLKRTYGRLVLVSCSLVALVAACRGAGTTGAVPTTDDTAATDDTGAGASDASSSTKKKDAASDPCADGKSHAAAQSCCEDLGVDACGANLFCAAFDGPRVHALDPEQDAKQR